MKLVINSNIKYKKPLSKLFESLSASGFKQFKDTVVVVGQSERDSEPMFKKISEVTESSLDEEVVLIEMKLNNYDYTGYHALNIHNEHPLIKSNSYFYLLDTCTTTRVFKSFFKRIKIDSDELFITDRPHSNICVFGNDVIKNYSNNFAEALSKDEAIRLEFEEPIEKNVKGISNFGRIKRAKERILVGEGDIYKTGHPRKKFYYPDFGVSKWIFWEHDGDIIGTISKNNPF